MTPPCPLPLENRACLSKWHSLFVLRFPVAFHHLLQLDLLGQRVPAVGHGAEVVSAVRGVARVDGEAGDAGAEAVAEAGGEDEPGWGGLS